MYKIFCLFILLLVLVKVDHAQTVRSVKDSVGFCWNSEEMDRFVDFLRNRNKVENEPKHELVGAISVHDDYLYAGDIYYPLFKQIATKEVVIFGVTHGSVRKELGPLNDVIILDEYDEWQGVYSNVKISPLRNLIKSKLNKENYIVSNKAHSIEHSIEALIPFLQYYNRGIKITPIMIPQMSFDKLESLSQILSEVITSYIKENNLKPGKDIFFLISNDANHYGEYFNNSPYGLDLAAHKKATDADRAIITKNIEVEINPIAVNRLSEKIIPAANSKNSIPLWCGRYPITFGLLTIDKVMAKVEKKRIEGKLFRYSDTLTEKVLPFKNTSMGLTAVFSPRHWCGWFTLGLNLK